MSRNTAARAGSARSGARASGRRAADTHLVCPLMTEGLDKSHALKLALTGTAAGVFSGLLGVGGGTVIVPLLVLWLGYGEREATGTSLSAIAVIAVMATILQGVYGNVDATKGLLVGIPAVAGVLLGTWIQQRVHTQTIGLLFAVVLVAAAVDLALT